MLRGLASDPRSVRSLSTVRVSTLLLELVPQRLTFRACLRAVRAWAKRRGVYSQKVGVKCGLGLGLGLPLRPPPPPLNLTLKNLTLNPQPSP